MNQSFISYYFGRVLREHSLDFGGVMSRSEYWKFVELHVLLFFFLLLTTSVLIIRFDPIIQAVLTLGYLLLIIYAGIVLLSASVRRLHDIAKSGWMLVLSIVPIANIYILYLLCCDGESIDEGPSIQKTDWATMGIVVMAIITIGAFLDETEDKSDYGIAERIDGSWVMTHSDRYEDGSIDNVTQYLTFRFDDTPEYNGTFEEILEGDVNGLTFDNIDICADIKYSSTIKGTYIIVDGDLCLTYDINSLTVNVPKNSIEMDLKNFPGEMTEYFMSTYVSYPKTEIAKLSRESIYRTLIETYSSNGDNTAKYENVQIKDSVIRITTKDGIITLNRVIK